MRQPSSEESQELPVPRGGIEPPTRGFSVPKKYHPRQGQVATRTVRGVAIRCVSAYPVQPPVPAAGGSAGGSSSWGELKSNMSRRASALASRPVSAGRLTSTSTKRVMDVEWCTSCETYPGLEYGEITTAGSRRPRRLKYLASSGVGGQGSGGGPG